MIEAMVKVKHKGATRFEGVGRRQFRCLPRIGESLEIEIGEEAHFYRVVAVHHPWEPVSTVGDNFAVYQARADEAWRELENGS